MGPTLAALGGPGAPTMGRSAAAGKKAAAAVPKVLTKDPASAKKKLPQQSQQAAAASSSTKLRPGQVLKCLRCKGISSSKRWFETAMMTVKHGDPLEQAVADKCLDCGTLHKDGFGHLSWEEFAQRPLDDMEVREAEVVARGGEPSFMPAKVADESRIFLEVRHPVQVLNDTELKKAMGLQRLTKHMKSVPHIVVPRLVPTKSKTPQQPKEGCTDDDSEGNSATERLWCFADPRQRFRTGSIVQIIGATRTMENTEAGLGRAVHGRDAAGCGCPDGGPR